MKQAICIAFFCVVAFAAPRTELVKVIKVDTVIQIDTIKFLKYDTLKITKAFKDTAIFLKQDTAVAAGKPIKIIKK